MKVFEYMEKYGHEQISFFHDKETGLKGITAIHDTTLGPAIGGTRLYDYQSEDEALFDVVRLSRGMTYKCAAAECNTGGGKSVLIGNPNEVKNEAYLRAYGRYVQSLNGRFYTGEDMNISEYDVDYMMMESDCLNGRADMSGNPSPVTAYGVYWGVKASAKEKWGNDCLKGKTIAVQGLGAVGYTLCDYLYKEGAKLIVTDINENRIEQAVNEFDAKGVAINDIYGVECDIFSPNSIGAILNDQTIPQLTCEIVAGAANNVLLEEEKHGTMLTKKGILYAPDFVINGGGLVNVYQEFFPPYNRENALKEVKKIYNRLLNIFKYAKEKNLNTQDAATELAKNRIETLKNVRSNYIPNAKSL
ncbi:Leu/Phe/Val dehydrogenase [Haloplasma contractile]|uniref:Leucine dehydrogenase protein n=1 Tax=Haloplasma contractile SSD-17B TaxID=1033810 RepID=U2E9V5_9MOLU|nr:Glu/Leu/Phe/Val dehydrogenase dimerization domain-containing protein [Haloplasma contractile]ERJ11621.1 Leucine dehydrogenase protein [Haloplasma contractile SSD-17B]